MPLAKAIGVAVVEDDREDRERLTALLTVAPGFVCLAACSSAEEALTVIPPKGPDVVLMDIQLPGLSGIACVGRLKEGLPQTQIMMLTVFEDHERIFQSLAAGATGYLLKKTAPEDLLEAIAELHRGGSPMSGQIGRLVVSAFHRAPERAGNLAQLTPAEDRVLRLIARGLLYKEIADELGISLGTVRTHIHHIYDKLHVHNRTEATNRFFDSRKWFHRASL